MTATPPIAKAMRRGWAAIATLAVLCGVAAPAWALPDLRTARPVGGLMVYSDDKQADVLYYAPPDLRIATDSQGKPDFHFLDTRYVGNVTSSDRGQLIHRSLISFRVLLPAVPEDELTEAGRTALPGVVRPEWRPLPIRRLEAALVYASTGSHADTSERALQGGHFESATATTGGYWTERVFTLSLDANDAQLFREALDKGQLILSLGYVFVADGVAPDHGAVTISGSSAMVRALKGQLAAGAGLRLVRATSVTAASAMAEAGAVAAAADSAGADSIVNRVVKSGALRIGIDAQRWPDLIKRVDLNDRMPPGYAALDVYCYDFRDALRPDLAEKWAEIEAQTFHGASAALQAVFRNSQPDVYAASLKFPVAVRVDRPYRYRVVEVRRDGQLRTGPWVAGVGWTRLLDVTSTSAVRAPEGVRAIR